MFLETVLVPVAQARAIDHGGQASLIARRAQVHGLDAHLRSQLKGFSALGLERQRARQQYLEGAGEADS